MSTEAMVGQFDFLNRMRKERRVVSLYLVSGIRFLGRVMSFDREGLLLDTKHGQLLFQQRQISTIGPDLPKSRVLRTGPGAGQGAEPTEPHYPDPLNSMVRTEPMMPREPRFVSHAAPARPAVTIIRKPRREFVRDPEE